MPIVTGNGGSSPAVGCVLSTSEVIDLHNGGNPDWTWDLIYGNTQSYPVLAALPADIGFTKSAGNSDLTFTATGVWSYTIGFALPAADATIVGFLHSTIGLGLTEQFGPVSAAEGSAWLPTLSEILLIGETGTSGGFNIQVSVVATGTPYVVTPTLTIVRLA